MAEDILTAGQEQQAELADIQARLATLMANAQDDKSRRLVLKQIIVPLTESLPDVPLAPANEPAPLSESARCLLCAHDKLGEASALAEFVQSISITSLDGGTLTLEARQLTGFFLVMQNAINLMREAETLINKARKQPEELLA